MSNPVRQSIRLFAKKIAAKSFFFITCQLQIYKHRPQFLIDLLSGASAAALICARAGGGLIFQFDPSTIHSAQEGRMKKTILFLIAILCAGLAPAQNIDVSANAGILTRGDFAFDPLVLSGNITLAFSFGSFILVSPECTLYSDSKFSTDSLIIAPGGTINFATGQLFLGAGVIKEIWLKSSDVSLPLELKLQVGIRASKFRLGAYMLTFFEEMFKDISFGFTIGFSL